MFDQGWRDPGGGTGRFTVMRICPSGPTGIAVMGSFISYDVGTVFGLAFIRA
jgi:hypothetical protein